MAYGTAPPVRLRGRIPLLLAAVFGVLGIALAVLGVRLLVHGTLGKVDGFTRVTIADTPTDVRLTSGGYVAYYEGVGRADLHLRLAAADGTPVHVGRYGNTLTYDVNGRHGEAVFTFRIAKTGTYTVRAESDGAANGRLAFGGSIAGGLVGGVLTLIPGILLVIAAIVLFIVGLVRRGNHKNQLRGPLPPPPGYGPPGYGPRGYGPPGYGPGYPPPGAYPPPN